MSEENKGKNEIQKEKVLQAKSGFGMLILKSGGNRGCGYLESGESHKSSDKRRKL